RRYANTWTKKNGKKRTHKFRKWLRSSRTLPRALTKRPIIWRVQWYESRDDRALSRARNQCGLPHPFARLWRRVGFQRGPRTPTLSLQGRERQEPALSEVEGVGQPNSFKIGKVGPVAAYCAKLHHANNERCIF